MLMFWKVLDCNRAAEFDTDTVARVPKKPEKIQSAVQQVESLSVFLCYRGKFDERGELVTIRARCTANQELHAPQ